MDPLSKMRFNNRLASFINEGKTEEFKSSIEKYNLRSITKLNLLHLVALNGNLELTEYLLSKGWEVNARDSENATPLICVLLELTNRVVVAVPRHGSVLTSHEKIVKVLLDANADVLVTSLDGRSALQILVKKFLIYWLHLPIYESLRNNLRRRYSTTEEAAKRLIEAGCHLNQAILLKDASIVEYMLENGYREDFLKPCVPEAWTMSLLHVAVAINDVESVKMLIKQGAAINAKDQRGRTPLYCVYGSNLSSPIDRIEMLKVFLNAGAVIDSSALGATLIRGSREAIRLLLETGLDVNVPDEDGIRGIHCLAVNINPGIAEELKIHKVKFDVNSTVDESGRNSLHIAAASKNVQMLEFLLERGANVDSVDNSSKGTSLFYAYSLQKKAHLKEHSDQCVELLLQYNANPQYIISVNSEPKTIFDLKNTDKMIERLRPMVAQIALIEKSGTPINHVIQSRIDSKLSLKYYLEKCRQVLNRKIVKRPRGATVFKFLTANEKTVARYLRKRELVVKLIRISHCQEFKSCYPYYYNTSKKRITEVLLYTTLKDKAAVLISQFLGHRFDKSNIVIERIIDYLDEQNLRLLHQV